MQLSSFERKKAWGTITIFLIIVSIISALVHYAIVKLYPSRLYIGGLMWCPAVAAIITLKIRGKSISSIDWGWGDWKYIRLSYAIPVLYVFVTYFLIWIAGYGDLVDGEKVLVWANEIGLVGIGTLDPVPAVIIGVFLLGTVGVIRAMATTLGEEIGWRGFFIHKLREVLPFTGTAAFSGVVWAAWHWPLIVYYGDNIALEFATFFVVIISMSFIMAYYAFKARSLWPAVVFHAVSNVYIQKIFPPLTTSVDGADHWHGEYGIMFAAVTFVFGVYFWRKAVREGL
ncbi:CPBP family intramembrane glutamic endopeptidase [Neolewinella persica]|uniref:CPBP family intramembrane glutamic endopeptidase n=1 Tax=Neolewinella persica TaxID=70998 RepID=UPI00036E6974|nr:type II CAAX endopeptidase family protein [Neolewinella persica]